MQANEWQGHRRLDLSAQRIHDREIGSGFTSGRLGLRFNYEISRELTPYLDFRYDRKLGGTARIADNLGERSERFTASLGIRIMF